MRAMTVQRALMTVTAAGAGSADPEMTITTSTVDRMGDIVEPDGMDARNFLKNPVLLVGHVYTSLPVGSVTSLERRGAGWRMRWRWLENDEFADRVRNGWEQGVIRSCSIGFKPLTMDYIETGIRFKTWELLEVSLVAVPANPEAVRTIKALGLSDYARAERPECPLASNCYDTGTAPCPAPACPMDGAAGAKSGGAVYDLSGLTPEEIARAVAEGVTYHIRREVPKQARAALARLTGRLDDEVLTLRDDDADEIIYDGDPQQLAAAIIDALRVETIRQVKAALLALTGRLD